MHGSITHTVIVLYTSLYAHGTFLYTYRRTTLPSSTTESMTVYHVCDAKPLFRYNPILCPLVDCFLLYFCINLANMKQLGHRLVGYRYTSLSHHFLVSPHHKVNAKSYRDIVPSDSRIGFHMVYDAYRFRAARFLQKVSRDSIQEAIVICWSSFDTSIP